MCLLLPFLSQNFATINILEDGLIREPCHLLFSVRILTQQKLGEVRYVKTCQVRSGGGSRWRRCSFPAAGSKNHLGNFHCLAKPLCAPFKISVHSVFCDFSCFFTTLFTVQKITVHCLKSVLKVSDLCMYNIFVISLVVGLTLGSPIKCKCKLFTICLL